MLLLLDSLPLWGGEIGKCQFHPIQFLQNGRLITQRQEICHGIGATDPEFLSRGCLGRHAQCRIFERAGSKSVPLKNVLKQNGNPMFLACHQIGGVPQSFQYMENDQTSTAARCMDLEDQSFVEIGWLFRKVVKLR